MTALGSVAAITARIAAIESRFAPPPGFDAALAQASGDAPAPPPPSGSAFPAGASSAIPAPVFAATSAAGTAAASAAPAAGLAPVGGGGSAAAPGSWAAALPAEGRRWAGEIEAAARKAGVDPRLLASLTWAESGFNATARSHAGAIGLTQLMPGTAAGLGVDPTDPLQNLAGGARYLKQQLDRFGSPALALAAYNAGPGRVARAGGIPNITETRNYVTRVLGYYDRLT